MRLVIKLNDVEYVLTAEQADALTKVLFSADIHQREWLGNSVPESERWLHSIIPATDTYLKCDIMDEQKYAALVAVGKMRKDATK